MANGGNGAPRFVAGSFTENDGPRGPARETCCCNRELLLVQTTRSWNGFFVGVIPLIKHWCERIIEMRVG